MDDKVVMEYCSSLSNITKIHIYYILNKDCCLKFCNANPYHIYIHIYNIYQINYIIKYNTHIFQCSFIYRNKHETKSSNSGIWCLPSPNANGYQIAKDSNF